MVRAGITRRFTPSSLIGWLMAGLLLLTGLGVRLSNLANLPLDFHPTRQLRSAIIARGMYYQSLPNADPQQRETAIGIWQTMEAYEPPLLERLVAFTYRLLGSEKVWVARIYSSLFWVIGGAALFALCKRLFSTSAALFSLGFYLLLPWGVVASRSFQPDPLMVMSVLLAVLGMYCWVESAGNSWRWALIAGIFAGFAMLMKPFVLYPLVLVALFLIVSLLAENRNPVGNFLRLIRLPQLWAFALLSAVIPGIYYLGMGNRSSEFASFWIFSFSGLLSDRKFYIHWLGLIRGIVDVMIFFAALLGTFLFPHRGRALAAGLWLGYFLIGATFPFQIYTHDYYSLILVPIVAIGLAPYAGLVRAKALQQPRAWLAGLVVALAMITAYYAFVARQQLFATNYRAEAYAWEKMGKELPTDGTMIAITHDYGNRLKYLGWRTVHRLWPSQGDFDLAAAAGNVKIDNFPAYFKEQTDGMDYFLVTLFGDFDAQPDLKTMLYDHYPVYRQGDGYIVFDLRKPKP